jgi:hypothetical protein
MSERRAVTKTIATGMPLGRGCQEDQSGRAVRHDRVAPGSRMEGTAPALVLRAVKARVLGHSCMGRW